MQRLQGLSDQTKKIVVFSLAAASMGVNFIYFANAWCIPLKKEEDAKAFGLILLKALLIFNIAFAEFFVFQKGQKVVGAPIAWGLWAAIYAIPGISLMIGSKLENAKNQYWITIIVAVAMRFWQMAVKK